jgi:hypothetical protein
VLPKVVEDLSAFIARPLLFPVKASLRESKDVDVIGAKGLTEVLKVDEVVAGADAIGVL